jgi:hypothetical protein
VAIFVINEWIWHDSSGTNGRRLQRQSYDVITRLGDSDHQIVIIEGSAFDKKAWNTCKNPDPIVGLIAGAYVVSLRQNSDRCRILKPNTLMDVPAELAAATKADDHYLLHALLTVEGSILVTTDIPLLNAVREAGLSCISREEFWITYF